MDRSLMSWNESLPYWESMVQVWMLSNKWLLLEKFQQNLTGMGMGTGTCPTQVTTIWAASWENRFLYKKPRRRSALRVTMKLISDFVFATRIVQSLYFLNPKFQTFSHFLRLYSPVCVRPGRKPQSPVFSFSFLHFLQWSYKSHILFSKRIHEPNSSLYGFIMYQEKRFYL